MSDYRTEHDEYWSRDAAGQVYHLRVEQPPLTLWERMFAPLANGALVACLMVAAGLFGICIGYMGR